MPNSKPTLSEMHQALDDILAREERALFRARNMWPTEPQVKLERRVAVLKALLTIVATLATFEDKSRDFIVGLQEEHRRG